jgi:5-methylthioadenosine/S-adenosylhomocysteine deaminase
MTEANGARTCDTLIRGTVLTIDPERRVFVDGFVAIRDGRVADVGQASDCDWKATGETLDGDLLVMPGLVNTHAHLVQGNIRGMAEGTTFEERLFGFYYPMMAACDEDEAYTSAMTPILEMLRSGITTTQDAHFAHVDKRSIDGVLRAISDAGIRCRMTRQVINDDDTSPANYHEDLDTAIREVERVKKEWDSDRIRVTTGPLGIAYIRFDDIKPLFDWTRAHDSQFDLHIPTYMDGKFLKQRGWDRGSYEWLYRHDMLDRNTLLVGGGGTRDGEMEMIAEAGASVSVHADAIFMGRKSEVKDFLERGVTVALGIDGPVIAYHQNLWYLMRHVCAIQRLTDRLANPAAGFDQANQFGGPELALELGTIHGAKALGWDGEIGSLEVGKQADLLVMDLSEAVHLTPRAALVNNLVYCAGANQEIIKHVYVGGRKLVEDGRVLTVDVRHAVAAANAQQLAQLEETGSAKWINNKTHWSWIGTDREAARA